MLSISMRRRVQVPMLFIAIHPTRHTCIHMYANTSIRFLPIRPRMRGMIINPSRRENRVHLVARRESRVRLVESTVLGVMVEEEEEVLIQAVHPVELVMGVMTPAIPLQEGVEMDHHRRRLLCHNSQLQIIRVFIHFLAITLRRSR